MCCNKKNECRCRKSDNGLKRNYVSTEEQKEILDRYKQELLKEIAGVDEARGKL